MGDTIPHDFDGDLEDAVEFTPDFDIDASDGDDVPVDEQLFIQSMDDGLKIFRERRIKYGSHIDNDRRFPMEHRSLMYGKCARIIRMIERGEEIDDDTLLDFGNYCHMMRSVRLANEIPMP